MVQPDPIRVVQLSDTHFRADDAEPEGGFGYDTDLAFEAVRAHALADGTPDLVTVTGDVADWGTAADYHKASAALARLDAPVNACPGNHDRDLPYGVGLAGPGVATTRAMTVGNWCFLFADSNAGLMRPDPSSGQPLDPPDHRDRLHGNGAFGDRESAWLVAAADAARSAGAEHLFVWVHHPPRAPGGVMGDPAYDAEWDALLPQLPDLRGIGAGHTHLPSEHRAGDVPVYVAPSLKNNFDLDAGTLLPPGYRTYRFHADGTVDSRVELVDDDADHWPRCPDRSRPCCGAS